MTCDDASTDNASTEKASVEKMDCLDAVEDLYTYLDGEIDDAKRGLIKAHLDDCGPCLDAFGFQDDLKRLVSDGCRSELPEGFRAKVLAAIDELSAGTA